MKERDRDKESICPKITNMMETGRMDRCLDMGRCLGRTTQDLTRVTSSTISSMGKEFTPIEMEKFIVVLLKTARNTEREKLIFPGKGFTRDSGNMIKR